MLSPNDLKLRDKLWSLSLEAVLVAFDQIDQNGLDQDAIRDLCRVNLFYLIIKILKWTEYVHHWSYARINEVDQEPNGCVDLWARGHGKSSIITVAKTLQDMINIDNVAIIVFSHTHAKALKHTRLIKSILENNTDLKSLFPERFYQDPQNEASKWTETDLFIKRTIDRKESTLKTCGFNKGLPTGDHADILIYDDCVTEESVTTSEQIEKTKMMFEQSKALGSMNVVERIIGTRYAFNDLFNDMIEGGHYQIREYPATDNGQMDGKLVMFTPEHWTHVTAPPVTQRMISNQYLLDPMSAMERVFNIDNLQKYEVREHNMNVYILVDPASSKKKGSCDTAMAVVGIGGKKRKYLLDGYCHKMNLGERYLHIRALYNRWRRQIGVSTIVIGYETYGAGNSDYEAIIELMKRDRGSWDMMKIVPLEGSLTGSSAKNDRIERIQPDLDAGMIFVPYDNNAGITKRQKQAILTGNEGLIAQQIRCLNKSTKEIYDLSAEFTKQLMHFPLGAKKDLIDAFSRIYDMQVLDPSRRTGGYALPPEELT